MQVGMVQVGTVHITRGIGIGAGHLVGAGIIQFIILIGGIVLFTTQDMDQ